MLKTLLAKRWFYALTMTLIVVLLPATAMLWWLLPPWPSASWQVINPQLIDPDKPRDFKLAIAGNTLAFSSDLPMPSRRTLTVWKLDSQAKQAEFRPIGHWHLMPDGQKLVFDIDVSEPFAQYAQWQVMIADTVLGADAVPLPDASGFRIWDKQKLAITTQRDGPVKIWELRTGIELPAPLWNGKYIWRLAETDLGALAWEHAEGDKSSEKTSMRLWNIRTQERLLELPGCRKMVPSPAGKQVFAEVHAKDRPRFALWETSTGNLLGELKDMPKFSPNAVSFSPDSSRLAIELDSTEIWDTSVLPPRPLNKLENAEVLAFSPDSKSLSILRRDPKLGSTMIRNEPEPARCELWDAALSQRRASFETWKWDKFTHDISQPGFAPDGKSIAFYTKHKTAIPVLPNYFPSLSPEAEFKVLDVETGSETASFPGFTHACWLPNSRAIATFREQDGIVRIWDLPLRRSPWVDYGLVATFVLLAALGMRYRYWVRRREQSDRGPM